MPLNTKHYSLPAFLKGEKYSAKVDKSRFTLLDNKLYFLSDIFEDGKISGWDLSSSGLDLTVSSGVGLIKNVIARTFGDQVFTLLDDSIYYIYMQKKDGNEPGGILGQYSSFTDYITYNWIDNTPPAKPTGLSSSATYDSVSLIWNNISEADLSYYNIEKSVDNINFINIGTSLVNSFTDNNVSSYTTYYYRISAVDTSKNISSYSDSLLVLTSKDLRPPLPPSYFFVLEGDTLLQLAWNYPSFGNISSYEITIQPVDSLYNPIGTPQVFTLGSTVLTYIISGLQNNQIYLISIASINSAGVYSVYTDLYKVPKANSGPTEINNLQVTSVPDLQNNTISLTVTGTQVYDPYFPLAANYYVYVIENGVITSDAIPVSFNSSISINVYSTNNKSLWNKIKNRTDYIVLVKGQDIFGNYSNGIIAKTKTGNSIPPASPSNLEITLDINKLNISWKNSVDIFNYNLLSIVKKDLNDVFVENIITDLNIGKAESYILENIDNNFKYYVSIKCVDEYSLYSEITTQSYTLSLNIITPVPVPVGMNALGSDKQVLVLWTPPNYNYVLYYKVWRSLYTGLSSSSFELIDTIPYTQLSYIDYNVENDNQYVYFTTSVDIFGNESLNPVSDGYISYIFATAFPTKVFNFSPIANFSLVKSGTFDITLSWNQDLTEYDGYEIYRSIGDNTNWGKIGDASYGVTSYVDSNALASGTNLYYYMIRKYRNECRVIIDSVAPSNSIELAQVVTSSGSCEVTEIACNIKSFKCMMDSYLTNAIESHHHKLYSQLDMRIDLSENVRVTNWTTSDNIIFYTTENIVNAEDYIVRIDGVISSTPYELDITNKKIIFHSSIAYTTLELECVGLNETQNTLSSDQLGTLSAYQSNLGKVNNQKLPEISHYAREEELIPLSRPMYTEDGYTFSITENINTLPVQAIATAITFYDIIKNGLNYIAATSKGILVTQDFITWQNVFSDTYLIHKIFYSSSLSKYFGLANGYVYISGDGIGWSRTNKIGNSYFIRDITDNGTTVFVTSESGVYKFDNLVNWGNWIELTKFNGRTTDSYAIIYLNDVNKILVSSDIGAFESSDDGLTWRISPLFNERSIIFDFTTYNDYVFALTNDSVLRRHLSNFDTVANFNTDKSRKIRIYNDKLYISTEDGVYESTSDILSTSITLKLRNDVLKINNKKVPITLLSVITDEYLSSEIFFGTDKKLYNSSYEAVYDQGTSIAPTFYVNDMAQTIGVFYNLNNNTVCFDTRINYNEEVSVANQYQYFRAKRGGWLNEKFDAKLNLYINNVVYLSYRAGVPLTELNAVTFDTFTGYNSNNETANAYETEYLSEIANFSALVGSYSSILNSNSILSDGKTVQYYISLLNGLYEKAYSQYLGDIKYTSTLTIGTITYLVLNNKLYTSGMATELLSDYSLIENIAQVSLTNVTSPVSSGDISYGLIYLSSNYDKYDNIYANIVDAEVSSFATDSHEDIDNKIGLNNSGLSAKMSDVQQINVLKFADSINKNYFSENLNLYQSEIIIPYTLKSYWYDYINSTANFFNDLSITGEDVSLRYVSCICYVQNTNKVLIGSLNGFYIMDVSTLQLMEIELNNLDNNYIKDIKLIDNVIYVLTEDLMYISEDYGYSWSSIDTSTITGKYLKFDILGSNWVLCTSVGIFYKSIYDSDWSLGLALTNITSLITPDLAFVVANNSLYQSGDGKIWSTGRVFDIQVNDIKKYGSAVILCTNNGLRYDNGTFYGDGALSSSVFDVEGNLSLSSNLKFNDIMIREDNAGFIAGNSDGNYYIMNSGTITKYTDSTLDSIHKVTYIDSGTWLFSADLLKIPQLSYAIKLGTGIPF